MLLPKKTKFNKFRKTKVGYKTKRGSTISFGDFGLKIVDGYARINSRQIEAARKAINKEIKREGKLWIRIFPDIPVTAKPNETRMGKGKGSVDSWVMVARSGRITFELAGVKDSSKAESALYKGAAKLPGKYKVVTLKK